MFQGEAYQLLPNFEAQFVADPPRVTAGRELAQNHDLLWITVIEWANSHRELIRKVTGGLRPYFPGNSKDILSLAQLVAFESLQRCLDRGEIDRFVPLFCKCFYKALIEQCRHVPVVDGIDVENLSDPNQSPFFPAPWPQTLSPGMKAVALARMLPRQAKVWTHYLDEWDASLSSVENARPFAKAAYYDLLRRGIDRVARKTQEAQS
jgi:hypothetical protein